MKLRLTHAVLLMGAGVALLIMVTVLVRDGVAFPVPTFSRGERTFVTIWWRKPTRQRFQVPLFPSSESTRLIKGPSSCATRCITLEGEGRSAVAQGEFADHVGRWVDTGFTVYSSDPAEPKIEVRLVGGLLWKPSRS